MYEELLKRQELQLIALEKSLPSAKNPYPLKNKISSLKKKIEETKKFIHLSK